MESLIVQLCWCKRRLIVWVRMIMRIEDGKRRHWKSCFGRNGYSRENYLSSAKHVGEAAIKGMCMSFGAIGILSHAKS